MFNVIVMLIVRFVMVIYRKVSEVLVSENVLVIIVVIVKWKQISLDVLLSSDLFFRMCIRCLGIGVCVVIDLIVIGLVGEMIVVNVKVIVSGIIGIIQ